MQPCGEPEQSGRRRPYAATRPRNAPLTSAVPATPTTGGTTHAHTPNTAVDLVGGINLDPVSDHSDDCDIAESSAASDVVPFAPSD